MNLHICSERPGFWSLLKFKLGRASPIRRVETEMSEGDLSALMSLPFLTGLTPVQILAWAQFGNRVPMTPAEAEDRLVTFERAREQLKNGSFKPQEKPNARAFA